MSNASNLSDDVRVVRKSANGLSGLQTAMILLVLGVSYMINAMDRQVFPAVLGPITTEYGLTLSSGGFLSNSFTLTVAIFGALSGWFMARFGRRRTLIGGMIAFSIFTALTPMAQGFSSLALFRSLTGGGEALHIGVIFACIGAYFGENRGMAIGVINAFFGLGSFLGPVLGSILLQKTGSWRTPFYVYTAFGIACALLVWMLIPKSFLEVTDTEGAGAGSQEARPPLRQLFSRNLILCAVSFGLVGFCMFSYMSLYATYLRTQLGYTTVAAAATFGMYGVGTLGGFFGGWLSDKLGTRGMLGALFALAAISYALFNGYESQGLQSVLSIAFGFLISGYLYPRCMATMQRNVAPAHVGYAMAVAIPMFYLPGLLAGYVFGQLTQSLGWGAAAIYCLSAPALLATVLLLFYRPSEARGGG